MEMDEIMGERLRLDGSVKEEGLVRLVIVVLFEEILGGL